MKMEYEVRYYFPSEKKDEIVEKLRKLDSLREKDVMRKQFNMIIQVKK